MLTALIVACALFMENLDGTVISTSLPAIAIDLHEDPIALKLALTSYLLSLAIFIPASGWAADRFGARTVFRLAILVFTLGSIACGLSSTLPQFVAARILQGMGGAMMVPVGRLVLLRSVERSDMVRALAYLTIPALIGPIVGPPVGGFITTYFHWRWIFWINVPIGVLGIALATIFIEDIREANVWPLDLRGFLLSGIGLSLLIFGLSVAGRGVVPWTIIALMVLFGVSALALYVWHARRAAHPILDLKLLRIRTFRAAVTGGSLFRVATGSIPFLLPLMLQIGFGMNAFQSGLTTFISSAGAMAMKTTAPGILQAFGFKRVLIYDTLLSGLMLAAIGFFYPSTPIAVMMGVLLIGGFFRSLEFTSVNALAYAEIEAAVMSRATSFSSVAQQLSLSLGVAIGASVLQTLRWFRGGSLEIADFQWAFLIMAVILTSAIASFIGLPEDAGSDLTRGAISPGEANTDQAAPVPRKPLAKT
jgi:EmrB/QacA subfamily drug resistance transporter